MWNESCWKNRFKAKVERAYIGRKMEVTVSIHISRCIVAIVNDQVCD